MRLNSGTLLGGVQIRFHTRRVEAAAAGWGGRPAEEGPTLEKGWAQRDWRRSREVLAAGSSPLAAVDKVKN